MKAMPTKRRRLVRSQPRERGGRKIFLYAGVALGFAAVGLIFSLGGDRSQTPTVHVERFELSGRPAAVAVDRDSVWVSDDATSDITALDPATGRRIGRPIHVERNPIALAVGARYLWVGHANGYVTRVDRRSRAVRVARLGRSITDVVFADGKVWASDLGSAEVLMIEPASLRVARRATGIKAVRLAAGRAGVWATTQNDTATRLRAGGTRETEVGVGRGPIGLAFDGSSLWVANSEDASITRIDRDDTTHTFQVGRGPVNVAVRGDVVWVTNQDDRTVAELTREGRALSTVPIGTHPRDISVTGDTVFVVGTDPPALVRLTG